MTTLVTGVLVLLAVGATLWFSLPKNGKPSVGVVLAPYIAVAITMGLFVGLGAMLLGFVRMVSNG
jgi:hypothetical protein